MRLHYLCAFLLPIALPILSTAQRNGSAAAGLFESAPIELVSNLTPVNRLDMIDYHNSGSPVGTENRLGSKVSILSLDDRQIEWQDDDSVKTSLAVLPVANDTIVMLIRTFPGRAADSEIKFYSTDWTPAGKVPFEMPSLEQWIVRGLNKKTKATVADAIPFMIASATFTPTTGVLTLTNNIRDYFSEKDVPDELSLLLPSLTYQWTGKTFKPVAK